MYAISIENVQVWPPRISDYLGGKQLKMSKYDHRVPAIIWGGKQYHTGGESFYGNFERFF